MKFDVKNKLGINLNKMYERMNNNIGKLTRLTERSNFLYNLHKDHKIGNISYPKELLLEVMENSQSIPPDKAFAHIMQDMEEEEKIVLVHELLDEIIKLKNLNIRALLTIAAITNKEDGDVTSS